MSADNSNPSRETPDTGAGIPASRQGSKRKWLIGGAAGLAALVGLGAVQAYSHPGWGGHRGGWHQKFDPARMGAKIDFGLDIILGRVGANDEQKAKVGATIKSLLKDVPEFRKGHMDARDQFIKLLKADKFDRVELERLRAERIKALDEASKKVVQAIGDVAETLTPAQRKELIELAEKRRRMFGRFGRH